MTEKLLIILIMMELGFLCENEILARLKQKAAFTLMFCYENKMTFPIYVSDQKFEDSMVILLATDCNKSHYVYTRDFDRFMFHKAKNKNKKILL